MDPVSIAPVAVTSSDVLRYAAAFFFVLVAIASAVALLRLAGLLKTTDKTVADLDREVVPLLGKAAVTIDEVNTELSRVDEIMSTVVEVTNKVDSTTRAVEAAVTLPAKKAAAFGAGVSSAVSTFFARREGGAPAGAETGATWPGETPWTAGGWAGGQAPASSAPEAGEAVAEAEAPPVTSPEPSGDGQPQPEAPAGDQGDADAAHGSGGSTKAAAEGAAPPASEESV